MKSVLVLLFVLAALAAGQTAPAPSYVAVGAGFNPQPMEVTGGAAYLRPVTDSGKTMAYTSATFTAGKPTTVEPGAAQRLLKHGPLELFALGTAGVAMGTGTDGSANVGTIFSGGGFAMFDLSKWLKNVGVMVWAREMKSTLTDAQPALFFAVTYKLGEE